MTKYVTVSFMPVDINGQGVKTKSKSFRMSVEAAAMLKATVEPKQYASSSLPTMKTGNKP